MNVTSTYLRNKLNNIKRKLSAVRSNYIPLSKVRINTPYKLWLIKEDIPYEVKFNPVRLMSLKDLKDYDWLPVGMNKEDIYVFTPINPTSPYLKTYEAVLEEYGYRWAITKWD